MKLEILRFTPISAKSVDLPALPTLSAQQTSGSGQANGFASKMRFQTWLITAVFCVAGMASAQGGAITLNWDANPEPDTVGYRLHYGIAAGAYTEEIDIGNSTTGTVSDLPEGVAYFFAVTAYNAACVESVPSNEVSYGGSPGTPKAAAAPSLTTMLSNQESSTLSPLDQGGSKWPPGPFCPREAIWSCRAISDNSGSIALTAQR